MTMKKTEKELIIKRFDKADEEWLFFVANNRKGNFIEAKEVR